MNTKTTNDALLQGNGLDANCKLILATIQGNDQPGVTAALMNILAQHEAFILDIGQSDIHNNLNLGILFETCEENSGSIFKDLLFTCYELGVKIRFTPIAPQGLQFVG